MQERVNIQVFLMKALRDVSVDAFDLQNNSLTETLKRLPVHLAQKFPIRLFDIAHHWFPRPLALTARGLTPNNPVLTRRPLSASLLGHAMACPYVRHGDDDFHFLGWAEGP
jgi:hypothetical protein